MYASLVSEKCKHKIWWLVACILTLTHEVLKGSFFPGIFAELFINNYIAQYFCVATYQTLSIDALIKQSDFYKSSSSIVRIKIMPIKSILRNLLFRIFSEAHWLRPQRKAFNKSCWLSECTYPFLPNTLLPKY